MTSTLAPATTDLPTPAGVTISRLSQSVGAKVEGLPLGGNLDTDTVEWLRTQLAIHKVLIVRGQQHLTDETQYAFAKLLGEPTLAHPTVVSQGRDNLILEGAANAWHTDVSFVDRVPKISILRAVQLPGYGGATEWANTVAAYNRLPEPLRDLADKLWAVHTNDYDYAAAKNKDAKDSSGLSYAEFTKTRFETEHPVVHVHPETGERSLLLGQFVSHLSDLRSDESTDLIRLFQARILKPDNTMRWHWEEGDVALWDNLATQHYGVADFGSQARLNHRVTLAGSVPVGVDGTSSRIISGDASEYSCIDTPRPLTGYTGDVADQ
ncbi:MAG TPA: TauD/TfdA family dioxygenase [Candidatus Corynebacterium avicola]|uniref:TauD/TfdA family dioxygenase n=1 Tax=Candidatus Corynebacterium avicola TaxID=2838527 RepID=A0A9D1RSS5_9CORY|nr:TauD/TfdA family dioxygenase [Candidatus Corynebacterium avicola]